MTETTIVACPHCDRLNRVPTARLGEGGKCGACGRRLFTGQPLALDAARFDRHAGAGLPLLVDFWAPWCGPCRTMAPAFEAAAGEFEPRLRLAKVDTQSQPSLAARYSIRSIPTLVLSRPRGRPRKRRPAARRAAPLDRRPTGGVRTRLRPSPN